MNRPLLKICGVTRPEEVELLAECGVEYFGLVVDVPSPLAVSTQRAAELAGLAPASLRPTLTTGSHPVKALIHLVEQTGVRAIQLGMLATPDHSRQLRQRFTPDQLTIIQEISYARGRFAKEAEIDAFLAAGADFILLDHLAKSGGGAARSAIPAGDLAAFRQRHPPVPILVAGAVSSSNAREILDASGTAGINACSWPRRDGSICRELVMALVDQLALAGAGPPPGRPTLRNFLVNAASGKQVIAYLTIGDPPGRFLKVANELIGAGALTLELGFPHPKPREGTTLLASHRRAIDAGVDTSQAIELFKSVAGADPNTPLIAVVQWPAIEDADQLDPFLQSLVLAGAAAILPVGVPLWQLPKLATRCDAVRLQTVLPCPPDTTRMFRSIAWRYVSGAIYVPRGAVTGGRQSFGDVDGFCRQLADETDLPIIVGVGINNAHDVTQVCRAPVKAAAIGSALVEHITAGGSPGEFIQKLLAR